MTLMVLGAPMPVELMLAEALDREWEAQSDRAAPLEATTPVRTLLELVLAGTPAGLFAADRIAGVTPEQLVAGVRDELPAELSPWALRALPRAGALRFSMPALLPGAAEPPALGAAREPAAPAPGDTPARAPDAPAPTHRLATAIVITAVALIVLVIVLVLVLAIGGVL